MIEVIDYGGGNIGSVMRCLERLDAPYRIVREAERLSGEYPLLFPGVGAFGAAMKNLRQSGLDLRLQSCLKAGTPYLGICIGLQVLFERSEEAPDMTGLDLIPGQVRRFQRGKVPQIGWNLVTATQTGWPDGHAYFVNSFYPQPTDPTVSLYQADYEGAFTAAVRTGNLTAFQFHPEKSGPFGETLIRRWLRDV